MQFLTDSCRVFVHVILFMHFLLVLVHAPAEPRIQWGPTKSEGRAEGIEPRAGSSNAACERKAQKANLTRACVKK